MANVFYNRGASFNPDELADGDAIEAEFDSVSRGFDTIEDLVNLNKAGYPSQTFHVAPATEATHAVQKAQLDASVASLNNSISATNIDLDQLQIEVGTKLAAASYSASDVLAKLKTVDGDGSGLDADNLDGYGGERYSRSAIATFGSGDWNSMNSHGTYKISHADFLSDTNPPPAVYPYGVLVVDVAEIGGEARVLQVYYPHGTTDKYIYQRMRNNGVWDAWRSIWRGGTGNGSGLIAEKIEKTVTGTDGANLIDGNMADNDGFRIRIYGTSSDAGAVEIATADNGTEPIYVRQYTGDFVTIARSATLLDGNGDTSFPGNVRANSFLGNASTASKLATARTISLGGDLSGSASFDGSGNITISASVLNVAVLHGTIAHGGTIPLPSGFTEAQCKWLVSMNADNPTSRSWDINEDGARLHYKTECYTTGRVVTARTYLGSNNNPPGWISSNANYIIIGVK